MKKITYTWPISFITGY